LQGDVRPCEGFRRFVILRGPFQDQPELQAGVGVVTPAQRCLLRFRIFRSIHMCPTTGVYRIPQAPPCPRRFRRV